MDDGCEFCHGEFSDTVVKEYRNWQVELSLDQYYLGRCLVKLKEHRVGLEELEEDERREFFEEVLPELKQALDDLFFPDLYNYCSLGNDCRHFHFHVIPRYESVREFEGQKFEDGNWNSHYLPYPDDFEISDKAFESLREELSARLG